MNQLPFSSINFGTCTLPEGRLVIKALLETSIKGIGSKHRTSIFPCSIFTLKKGINRKPGDPNYDLFRLALKSTAKRLYPNYCNGDFSAQKEWVKYDRYWKRKIISELSDEERTILISRLEENPELKSILMLNIVDGNLEVSDEEIPIEFQSTMGCRTMNGADINAKYSYEKNIKQVINNGKLYDNFVSAAQKDGRGNIVPSTIILPTLAMEALERVNGSIGDGTAVEEFMKILDKAIEDCKDGLIERFNYIASQPMESAKFMYENNMMSGYVPEEGIISALAHGTLAVGEIGLSETLQILIGCDHTEKRGMDLAKRIEQLYKDRCNEYKEKYKLNFGVYYTPERFCGRHRGDSMNNLPH